jgi:hypothetical protein
LVLPIRYPSRPAANWSVGTIRRELSGADQRRIHRESGMEGLLGYLAKRTL